MLFFDDLNKGKKRRILLKTLIFFIMCCSSSLYVVIIYKSVTGISCDIYEGSSRIIFNYLFYTYWRFSRSLVKCQNLIIFTNSNYFQCFILPHVHYTLYFPNIFILLFYCWIIFSKNTFMAQFSIRCAKIRRIKTFFIWYDFLSFRN